MEPSSRFLSGSLFAIISVTIALYAGHLASQQARAQALKATDSSSYISQRDGITSAINRVKTIQTQQEDLFDNAFRDALSMAETNLDYSDLLRQTIVRFNQLNVDAKEETRQAEGLAFKAARLAESSNLREYFAEMGYQIKQLKGRHNLWAGEVNELFLHLYLGEKDLRSVSLDIVMQGEELNRLADTLLDSLNMQQG